jgi:hypothetical protein
MASPISVRNGFLHVQDSYRWLSALTCCFESLRDFDKQARTKIDASLPNVDVAIQAGVLVYARGIIEFFSPASPTAAWSCPGRSSTTAPSSGPAGRYWPATTWWC